VADQALPSPQAARMFVAVVPPAEVADHLTGRVAAAVDAEVTGLRWTAQRNWHVTLAFLAALPPARVDAAVTELAAAAEGIDPFVLHLTGAGAFPRPARAGVVWIGAEGATAGDARALARLAKHVRIGLRRAHLRPDRTPFRPHLTVARVRPAADVTHLVERLNRRPAGAGVPSWPVGHLELIESRLGAGPDGTPAYATVATVALGR
jgi:RNA 2',3'-cyclic 3'-phosphodiesterase